MWQIKRELERKGYNVVLNGSRIKFNKKVENRGDIVMIYGRIEEENNKLYYEVYFDYWNGLSDETHLIIDSELNDFLALMDKYGVRKK